MTTSPDTLIYCFKCRAKTESNDLEQVVLKNRRDATRADLRRLRHQEVPHRQAGLTLGQPWGTTGSCGVKRRRGQPPLPPDSCGRGQWKMPPGRRR